MKGMNNTVISMIIMILFVDFVLGRFNEEEAAMAKIWNEEEGMDRSTWAGKDYEEENGRNSQNLGRFKAPYRVCLIVIGFNYS